MVCVCKNQEIALRNRKIRQFLKRTLPIPVKDFLRACENYLCRLLCWPIILWQVRGATIRDQWTLVQSAFFSPVISLRDLQAWQDPHLLRDALVHVPGVGVFSLRANTDDLWHVLPYREQSIANLLTSRLKNGDTFIDAGANIGVYTIQAARLVGESGKVISIEMMPDTAERLEAHIRMNDLHNVTLVRRALSDSEAQIVVATVQAGKYGQATIAKDSDRFGLGKQVSVETTTFDTVTEETSRVRLMKLDLEGAELAALTGAQLLLPKVEAVVYESRGSERSNADPVDKLLLKAGFNIRQLDGNNWLGEKAGYL